MVLETVFIFKIRLWNISLWRSTASIFCLILNPCFIFLLAATLHDDDYNNGNEDSSDEASTYKCNDIINLAIGSSDKSFPPTLLHWYDFFSVDGIRKWEFRGPLVDIWHHYKHHIAAHVDLVVAAICQSSVICNDCYWAIIPGVASIHVCLYICHVGRSYSNFGPTLPQIWLWHIQVPVARLIGIGWLVVPDAIHRDCFFRCSNR